MKHPQLTRRYASYTALTILTLLEGLRQRLLLVGVGIVLAGLLLAGFVGSLAVTEAGQIRSAFLGAFLRLAAALLIPLYLLHSQTRESQEKGLELLFSLPLTRTVYFLGKLSGYALLIVILVLLFAGTLLFFAPPAQVALWSGSLFLELWILAVFSFLVQLTIRPLPAAFIIVLFFYLLARTWASLELVSQGAIMPGGLYGLITHALLQAIAFVLPSLDRFTRSEWLAYGSGGWEDGVFVLFQGGSYLLLLMGIALIDLHRKNL